MGDVGEELLVDVSGVSLRDLHEEVDESALAQVLERILMTGQDGGHFGFNSSI